MAKMRVHELAKEINTTNKELLDLLKSSNIEVKSHMSSLSDEQIATVKTKYSDKKNHKVEGKTVREDKDKEVREEKEEKTVNTEAAAKEQEAPKKKKIVQVFRPQNSQNNARQGSRPANRPAQGQNPRSNANPSQARPQGDRPQNDRPQNDRPQGERNQRPAGSYQGQRNNNYQGNSNYQGNNNYQGNRPTGGQDRGQQRPYNNNGQRPNQMQGQGNGTGTRPAPRNNAQGAGQQRPYNNNGQRPTGGYQGQGSGQGQRYGNNSGGQGNRGGAPGQRPTGGYQGQNPGQGRRYDNNGPRTNNDQGNRTGGSNYQGQRRNDNRRPDQRNGQSPSIPAPVLTENQKAQRQKQKDSYKKKDHKDVDRVDRLAGKNGKKVKPVPVKPQPKQEEKPEEKIKMITIPEILTIQELADKMKLQPSVIVKKLFLQGKIVTVNQEVDFDTAEEIAMEFECLVEKEIQIDVIEELLKEDEEDETKMKKRPPVVCVMGHVDHGKTSLLDAIRHTNVTDREAGGITQHIGASVINVKGEKITFLDTPGHEAFTAMRMRGASSTDIAILVVAADDGVMPQTIEAINHAKAAGIEIIVAINKIDKPSANIERVKQELTEYELIPEDWGGSTIFVPVSAHSREGVEELLEMVLLTAEMLELKANPVRRARGLVIEAELDKGKGSVATVLVQKGTLRVGDSIAAGSAYGKVRAMMDDKGRRVKEAGPSMPVEILGLNDVPNAGEIFVGCKNDKDARSFAETFISQNKVKLLDDTKAKMSLDDLFVQIKAGNVKELGIVVKADVQGSVEAIKQSLLKLSNEEVVVKIIHGGVGAINESDVTLASASNAIIIGFNVRPDATAKETAEREGVDLRLYRVIYNAIEDVEAAMKGMLDPVFEEKVLGHAEIRQTFKASGIGTIAGSYVLDGTIERDCQVRITRDGIVIFDGNLASLKRFKDDVKEVKTGYECGFVFEKFNDVKVEDRVEAYKMVEIPR